MKGGRERGGQSMGKKRQRVVSLIHKEEALLCSGGWCPQPVMNGYPARAAREEGCQSTSCFMSETRSSRAESVMRCGSGQRRDEKVEKRN